MSEAKLTLSWARIFSRVKTPDGIGQIIAINMPANGLYISPEQVRFQVWYGTEDAQNGWIQREYTHDQIRPML